MKKTATTLTITRPYLEMIYQGLKRIEYRRDTEWNRKALTPKPDVIYLHYRKGVYLKVWVSRIRFIRRPKKLFMSKFITTEKCHAIEISRCRLMDKKQYDKDKVKYSKPER